MAAAALTLSSCSLDVNDDPNHPTTVEPSLVFPSAEAALATAVGDGFYNPSGFVQYYDQLPESEQYRLLSDTTSISLMPFLTILIELCLLVLCQI